MRKVLIVFTVLLLVLSGCKKGISQKDYDVIQNNLFDMQQKYSEMEVKSNTLSTEYESLKSENATLKNKLDELQGSYDTLSKENENNKTLSSEYMKLYMDASVNTDDIVTKAWGTAAFGDNTKFARVDPDTIQYNAVINETSQENINDFFIKFQNFAGALGLAMETENTKFTYIKVTDLNSIPVFELFIDTSNGTDNSKIDILMNELCVDLVKSAVNEIY